MDWASVGGLGMRRDRHLQVGHGSRRHLLGLGEVLLGLGHRLLGVGLLVLVLLVGPLGLGLLVLGLLEVGR